MKQIDRIISSDPAALAFAEEGDITDDVEYRRLHIGSGQHGFRIDKALVDVLPEFSRSYLQQLIEAGRVQLQSVVVSKSSLKVKAGEALLVELHPTPQSQAFRPEAMALRVVFEDAHLLVIDKPAGLVVHPAPGNWSGTLLNGLLAHDPVMAQVPRAGIVHRLDKDTSGLMVVAKTRLVMDSLVQAIAARDVARQYFAVAHKPWSRPARTTVEAAIGRDPRNRLRMAVVNLESSHGKTAKTDVILLDDGSKGCLVRCILHTGRTHQIRVHMAHLEHPLVGDVVYGGAVVPEMARQALHACRLAFEHPVTHAPMIFDSAPPEDFQRLISSWGLSYNRQL